MNAIKRSSLQKRYEVLQDLMHEETLEKLERLLDLSREVWEPALERPVYPEEWPGLYASYCRDRLLGLQGGDEQHIAKLVQQAADAVRLHAVLTGVPGMPR